MIQIIFLFIASFLVTAIFSSSLKVFFIEVSWTEVLTKGLVIPCFTWSVQLILSAILLTRARMLDYWTQLGWVCLIGSFVLLPAALYNFIAANPSETVSKVNVLASVFLMFAILIVRLRSRGFHLAWALSFLVVITINMSLYLYSIGRLTN
jgi:hypothetical protein